MEFLNKHFGLRRLFISRESSFPLHSSILIVGGPGAGKTALALSIVRENIRCYDKKAGILYIGQEDPSLRSNPNPLDYNWFTKDDPVFVEKNKFFIPLEDRNLPQPVKSPSELIQPIFFALKNIQDMLPEKVYVVVDTLSTLLKDSKEPGDRRRNTQDLLSGLRKLLGRRHGLVFLIAELRSVNEDEFLPEEYATDFVFTIRYRSLGLGRRLRCARRAGPRARCLLGTTVAGHQREHRRKCRRHP
jgi:archaellum biogenesis ATPase FlaH